MPPNLESVLCFIAHPKAGRSGQGPPSFQQSLIEEEALKHIDFKYDLGHIPELRTFGSSGSRIGGP